MKYRLKCNIVISSQNYILFKYIYINKERGKNIFISLTKKIHWKYCVTCGHMFF
jgi:hypothetical protein